jgi:hypothetical protein
MAATIASPKPLPSLERAWSFRLKRSKGAVEEILGEARTGVDHMKFDALVASRTRTSLTAFRM